MQKSLESLCPSKAVFAPMVGLSHYSVRESLSRFLPDHTKTLWWTEMLSSRRLPSQKEEQAPELFFRDRHRGLCPQLLANEEGFIKSSIQKLEAWGVSAIDINMGCPVKKVLRHNFGVSLMGDKAYAAKVVEWSVKNTSLPVSVKLRAGQDRNKDRLLEFCQELQAAGASWLVVHPRLASEKRRGSPDWKLVKHLKKNLSLPIIANGDIQTPEDAWLIMEETGCDRVMVGRALLAKPWLLQAINDPVFKPNQPEKFRFYQNFLSDVLTLSFRLYPEASAVRKFRFLVYHSHPWFQFGHQLYASVKNSKTKLEFQSVLEQFFERPKPVFEKTLLAK